MELEIPEKKGSGSGARVHVLPGWGGGWWSGPRGGMGTGAGVLFLPLSVPDLVALGTQTVRLCQISVRGFAWWGDDVGPRGGPADEEGGDTGEAVCPRATFPDNWPSSSGRESFGDLR